MDDLEMVSIFPQRKIKKKVNKLRHRIDKTKEPAKEIMENLQKSSENDKKDGQKNTTDEIEVEDFIQPPKSDLLIKKRHLEKVQAEKLTITNAREKPFTSSGPSTSSIFQQSLGRFQFAELNLRYRNNPQRMTNMVRRAIRMGYDSVVINVDIGTLSSSAADTRENTDEIPSDVSGPPKKKKKKGESSAATSKSDIIPDPFLVDTSQLDLSPLEVAGKKFRQFSRLTVTIDANSVHRLQHHPKLRLYDIVAVRVPNEQLLMTLQRKGDFVDIITLDSGEGRLPWLLKHKIVQSCIAAGISFELCYSDALCSSENRRQFFTNARQLMSISRRGRGVVLSSGAEDLLGIRGPFDAANLCVLFGLNPKEGRKFVSSNARDVLLRAESRRSTIRGTVHMTADLSAIPSALAVDSAVTLAQLCAIPEFAAELRQTNIEQENTQKGGKIEEAEEVEQMETEECCALDKEKPFEGESLFEIFD